eukprot:1181901-Prorocentrum_minimum.AAC.2
MRRGFGVAGAVLGGVPSGSGVVNVGEPWLVLVRGPLVWLTPATPARAAEAFRARDFQETSFSSRLESRCSRACVQSTYRRCSLSSQLLQFTMALGTQFAMGLGTLGTWLGVAGCSGGAAVAAGDGCRVTTGHTSPRTVAAAGLNCAA